MRKRRRLTAESVVAEARSRTGLERFARDDFLVPLQHLLDDLRGEKTGPDFRTISAWMRLVGYVDNRLRIDDALAADPSIAEREIERPLFIVGTPRTGTTLLHNLLALDPTARAPRLYEIMSPVPDPGPDQGRRIRKAELFVAMADRLAPDLASAHRLRAEGPEECLGLIQNTFVTPFMLAFARVEKALYLEWLEELDVTVRDRSYVEYGDQLRILQEGDARRWVLKCPCHLYGLDSILRVFPDAVVVHTNRDLAEVVPSLCSLQATVEGAAGGPDMSEIGEQAVDLVDRMLRWGMRGRDADSGGRILDVHFAELEDDPVSVLRRIYAHADFEWNSKYEQRARAYLDAHPRHASGRHRYTLEEYGLEPGRIEERFAWYATHTDGGAPEDSAQG